MAMKNRETDLPTLPREWSDAVIWVCITYDSPIHEVSWNAHDAIVRGDTVYAWMNEYFQE